MSTLLEESIESRQGQGEEKEEGEGSHYNDVSVATNYESAFFYDNVEYRNWLLEKLVPLVLRTRSSGASYVKVADVGGGTGNFTAALGKQIGLCEDEGQYIQCIDPFDEMLKHAFSYQPLVKPVLMGAVEFAQTEQSLHCILLKEVIHHIPEEKWTTLFRGFYKQLCSGGAVILITRPQEVEYPLFPRAAEIWKEHQAPSEPFCQALREAGFSVHVDINSYLVNLHKSVWFSMIENKFWSTFSHCTEDELSDGLQFLEKKHSEKEMLTFHDNLVFIVATKPSE